MPANNNASSTTVRYQITLSIIGLLLTVPLSLLHAAPLHHDLDVSIDPERGHLSATATVTLPSSITGQEHTTLRFLLHPGLTVEARTTGSELTRLPATAGDRQRPIRPARYEVTVPDGSDSLTLAFEGRIVHPVRDQPGDRLRGVSATPGIIASDGVFLGGASLWYPQFEFDNGLFSFSADIRLPAGWTAVSQGRRAINERGDASTRVRWEEANPQSEIFLVAGRWHEFERSFGTVTARAFLHSDDAALAGPYLDATGRYLAMFSKLLGPYPYDKFALVENFWETGYGMPSFTLLGSSVIRLPFILHSSYPHELMHNWWGNGVYVDYSGGNWAEGLTSYLADHLLQEQRGEGATMRRNHLQRYADHVDAADDFPLIDFRGRYSPASEAVGYGKALMFFHMLRRRMGDEAFVAGLRDFYRDHLFRVAGWEDLRIALAGHAGDDLRDEFRQWTIRSGAPRLRIDSARSIHSEDDGYLVELTLAQTQPGPDYDLRIPLAIALEGHRDAWETEIRLQRTRQQFHLALPARPLRIEVDPQFDVFRRVDRLEIPPALSQAFSAPRPLLVIAGTAPAPLLEAFHGLARDWRGTGAELTVVTDNDLDWLPDDRDIWLLGWDNRFVADLHMALAPLPVTIDDGRLVLPDGKLQRERDSAVLVARHPADVERAMTWLATDDPHTVAALARRLPHFGRFGWLGFDNASGENTMRGQWPVTDSPLAVDLAGDNSDPGLPMQYAPRKPLTGRD